jgi:hypothetical protein
MSPHRGLRAALLRSVLVTCVIVAVVTELFSLVHWLRPGVLLGFWLLVLAAALGYGWLDRGQGRPWALFWSWAVARLRDKGALLLRTPSVVVMVLVIVVILALTLLSGIAAPPNNWDSMTYHLPRVMHWAANGSVHNYPTSINRQLFPGPFAEYLLLQVYLLTGSDRIFDALQWCALVGCLLSVSLIARQLGGDRRAQALAAVATATVPMAILQASTTQNDLVEAFFLLVFVQAVLHWRSLEWPRALDAWELGAALSLALLAKDTAFILAGPFVILALAARRPWRTLLAPAGVVVALVVGLNLGLALRNQATFGSPLGDRPTAKAVANTHFSPGVTVTGMLRLFATAATSSSTSLNGHLSSIVADGTKAVGVDPADSGLVFPTTSFGLAWHVQEDYSGYPSQVAAVLLICAAAALRIRPLRGVRAGYAVACLAAFVLFASYLRWQPWINRLDMPLMLLWTPLIGVALATWHRFLVLPAALVFVWLTPDFLLHNETRPLNGPNSVLSLPDENVLFATRYIVRAPYDAAAVATLQHHARTVGLIVGGDDWEYPLWRLTGGALHGPNYVDIRPSDLAGKPVPPYDVAICTDVTPGACAPLTRSGWTVYQLGAGVQIATKNP